jgi:hypothetical protein
LSDESHGNGDLPAELQPIVTRLQEIQRKCASLGPRNDEAQEMADRVDSIVASLSEPQSDDAEPPSYGQLAAQLFPVARLFESLGFISVAKEIAHVDRSLRELDPDSAQPAAPVAEVASSARTGPSAGDRPADEDAIEVETVEPEKRFGVPRPVALGLLLVVVTIVVAVLLVRNQIATLRQTAAVATPTPPVTQPSPTVGADQPIAAAPTASDRPTPTPGPRARLADLVGRSRLAYRSGDIDGAISLLSQAALIDNKANSVLDTAETLVRGLIARADAAADDAQWTAAKNHLDRARELAVRFELSTQPIDFAAEEHRRMVRYKRLRPDDIEGIRAHAGRRIIVINHDGERFEGQIHGVTGGVLEIHEGMAVGQGGTLFHVDEIPLIDIREIRVFPN